MTASKGMGGNDSRGIAARLGESRKAELGRSDSYPDLNTGAYPALQIVPIDFDEACAFVRQHHRHHIPPVGHKAALAVAEGPRVCGVAILGRPVSRALDDGWTLEVTRVATDGTRNAPSKLYGAAWKLAQALGYRRLVTYTLESEPGTSLRAVGWKATEVPRSSHSWSCKARPRVDKHPLQNKIRWEVGLTSPPST